MCYKELEQTEQYAYLGTLITDDGKDIEEIKRRIVLSKVKFWECKEFLRRDINLSLKIRILKCYVFSTLQYGCEAWAMNKQMEKKMHAFEMCCFRRMLKISWTDHVKYNIVLERIGAEKHLVNDIITRKMKYAGHVLRGSSSKLTNIIIEGNRDGKKTRGRPRRNWTDDLKTWTNSKTYGEIKRKAENRKE